MEELEVCLTVAGSDSGGEAGIQADMQAFSFFKCHALNAVTAVTAQNVDKVYAVNAVSEEVLRSQLQALKAYEFKYVKTGMLCNSGLVSVLLEELPKDVNLIIDPVMISSSGSVLLDEAGRQRVKSDLFSKAVVVTPNLPEINCFLGRKISDLKLAAKEFYRNFKVPVYLKGGHNDDEPSKDFLCDAEGVWELKTESIDNPPAVHGTGCRLSSAICANLAHGETLLKACVKAKAYMQACLQNPYAITVYGSVNVLGHIHSIDEQVVSVRKVE